MRLRVLLFEDQVIVSNAINKALSSEGYEVLDFISPNFCSLVSKQQCECPSDHVCADVIIADLHMPGMSGLELIRLQNQKGCRAPSQNKIIISGKGSVKEEGEILALGSHFLRKPFKLDDLLDIIRKCKANIPPNRKLTPCEVLQEVVQN